MASSGGIARIPGSKSITNRALLLAAAASGTSRLSAPLDSDDTRAFRDGLRAMGVSIDEQGGVWAVTGLGRGPSGPARISCHDAGTAARFLIPFAAAGQGSFAVDGSDQLRGRPLDTLVQALGSLDANIHVGENGGLPLRISASGLSGGELELDSSRSSQFLTGLLLVAPLMREPLRVRARSLVSSPYVTMTTEMMRRFGVQVHEDGAELFVPPASYTATEYVVEADASTASYFLAAAVVTGRSITVPNLGRHSLQGDLRFADVLRLLGADVDIGDNAITVSRSGPIAGGFSLDMGDISDTFMTLAAIAPLADGPITIVGVAHARLKESDRVAVMAENLRRCGVPVDEQPDGLTIHPAAPRHAEIACHRDHRIAMSFSILGLRVPGLTLDDPYCVSKTFPEFHQELSRLVTTTG